MQDSDSFICLYESEQCTGGQHGGVFSLKTVTKEESARIFDDFHWTGEHRESKTLTVTVKTSEAGADCF